jgi:hypothetical protein
MRLTNEEVSSKTESPDFAYRDLDYFFRKKKFFGHSGEHNVFAIFRNRSSLDQAVVQLQESGFRSDDIFIAQAQHGTVLDLPLRIVSLAPFFVPLGIFTGAILGALFGVAAQQGILHFLGIEPFSMGTIWESMSASSSVGSFVGGILGIVIGMRIPEYQPWRYETTAPDGSLFLVVRAVDAEETRKARSILEVYAGENGHAQVSSELAA